MQEPAAQTRLARPTAPMAFGILGSLLAHGVLYALIATFGQMPALDFELQLPIEAEFGLTDAETVTPTLPETTAAASEPADQAAASGAESVDATIPDQTATAPKPKPKPRPKPKPESPNADADSKDVVSAGDALSGFAPEGSQLSLRIHMQRIRDSEYVNDVRQLLAAIPDWNLILEGSQIDPVADLDRLFLASPDLRREKLVIAGQYNGDPDRVRVAVANMAAARATTAEWSRMGGIEVAPWHNADRTQRVIALVAPQQFVICRPTDLTRVLAVAEGLAQRAKKARPESDTAPAPSAGDALLDVGEDEVWSLSVEGARAFVPQRINAIPTRLQIGVRPVTTRKMVAVTAIAHFDDDAQAAEAKRYWDAVRNRFGSHPLVTLMGMSSPLMNARIEIDHAQLTGRSELNSQQLRMLLGFVRNAVTPPPPPPALPPLRPDPAPTPVTEPTPPSPPQPAAPTQSPAAEAP